jgi:glycosyltransferase involved in cell wall biosynthesis
LGGKKIVGFLGSFFHYEGLDLLIEAIARVVRHDPDVVLLLVGGGVAEAELRAQVERLQIAKHVIMPGAVAPDRIPGVYALVDVLAYPRHSIRLTEIVTPLKPLEAMAMGKALVASDVGGHHELIRDGQTGLLFPAGNVEALASVLQRLLRDVGLRRTLEQQGLEWVRRERSWEKTTEGYTEVYARAQARAPKRR